MRKQKAKQWLENIVGVAMVDEESLGASSWSRRAAVLGQVDARQPLHDELEVERP